MTQAQTIIKGRIVSAQTGKPIGYVNIGLTNETECMVSQKDGNFTYTIKENDQPSLQFSHVSYQTKVIPYTSYATNKPLIVKMDERKVNLPELNIVARYGKLKQLKGTGLRAPGNVEIGGKENYAEIRPFVRPKNRIQLTRISIDVKQSTFNECTLSFNIFQVKDKDKFTNILHKPIYYKLHKTDKRLTVTVNPPEAIIFNPGATYYIGLRVVNQTSNGSIRFPAYFVKNYTHNYKTGRHVHLPVGVKMNILGRAL